MSNINNKKILIACNALDFESLRDALNDKVVSMTELQEKMNSDRFHAFSAYMSNSNHVVETNNDDDDWFGSDNNNTVEPVSSTTIQNEIISSDFETMEAEHIRKLIANNQLSYEKLRQQGFSEKRIKSIEYYCNDSSIMPSYSIDKLKPMQEGRTDLYFIGLSRAGKSTILSGILYSANNDGRWQPDTGYHPEGIKFKNKILNDLYEGIIPKATPADSYNYIAATFIDEKNEGHPFNIVEMPGEDFRKIQDDFREADKYLRYINNDNRKIITFVIDLDYKNSYMSQMNAYTNFLSFFYEQGVLNNVESIYFILNKIDLVIDQNSSSGEVNQEVNRIFENDFKNLKRQADYIRKESKSNFKLKLMPFSIGTVKNDKILEKFNNEFSKNILSNLINDSFKPKGGMFGKFFKS